MVRSHKASMIDLEGQVSMLESYLNNWDYNPFLERLVWFINNNNNNLFSFWWQGFVQVSYSDCNAIPNG